MAILLPMVATAQLSGQAREDQFEADADDDLGLIHLINTVGNCGIREQNHMAVAARFVELRVQHRSELMHGGRGVGSGFLNFQEKEGYPIFRVDRATCGHLQQNQEALNLVDSIYQAAVAMHTPMDHR